MGVHIAANIFNLGGYLLGITPSGSLERHMFEHMGDALFVFTLVSGTSIHPDTDRNRMR